MSTERFEDWSAHHEVPDELAMALDLANTIDLRSFGGRRPREFLPDRESLDAWLAHRGSAGAAASEEDFARALDLRSAIRELADSHHGGRNGGGPETVRQDRPAFDLALQVGLDEYGNPTLTSAYEGARAVLARILATVVLAEAKGVWFRVKMCSAPDCRVVFYDGSKARNSRWCSSTGCGNRMKTRAYRTRRRSGAA
ncbi:CGNR zinc finger domain-containing protein [Nocardiopsis salina]|uniref:CGNR zinc finger domain-containing protein n=1 Tax=Nocardiopsis salina TaxID=245836 RepID=UPI00034BCBA3|nr:CGNR zinc finger domain-containing protein [Nocardiopsis salina]